MRETVLLWIGIALLACWLGGLLLGWWHLSV